jgi:hypothetical protein
MNARNKIQIIFANIPRNLLVPLVSRNPNDIPTWNKKVNEYIAKVFDFALIFLAFDGAILLLHLDDLKVLKEVKFYLKSYGFQIRTKWVFVNLGFHLGLQLPTWEFTWECEGSFPHTLCTPKSM